MYTENVNKNISKDKLYRYLKKIYIYINKKKADYVFI